MMSNQKIKSLGQYFTPPEIVNFMVGLIEKDKNTSIFEPCAGKGAFLKGLSENGFTNFTAYEIDKDLENQSDVKIDYKDTLLEKPKQKFDVIIGNPPYVRWKNIEQDKRNELKNNYYWKERINGLNDLLYLFIFSAIDSLKENGELIFITPTFWTSTMHSKALRKKLLEEGELTHFIDFNELKIFNGVASNILIFRFVKSKRNRQIKVIKVMNKGKISSTVIGELNQILSGLDDKNYITFNGYEAYLYKQFEGVEPWNPLPVNIEKVTNAIERNADAKLGYLANICNGMVSGLDEAFKVSGDIKFSEKEKTNLIKVVKAKNLDKYFPIGYTNYIFLNDKVKTEKELDKLVNIKSKIINFKERLNARYAYGGGIPWWHWIFLRNRQAIENSKIKIVVPSKERYDINNHVRFALIEGKYYISQDVSAIIKKPEIKEDIRYLLAVLNSDLIFLWLRYKGLKRGGVLEFSEKPLSIIPIKRINWENKDEVETYKKIIKITNNVLERKDYTGDKEKLERLIEALYGIS